MARIGLHQTGIHRKAFTRDQAFGYTARQYGLEQLPKRIAVTEPAMSVLGEGGMVRHFALQAQATEPAISQVQMHLLAQAPL